MEENIQDKFFIIPLMGGILCLIQIFDVFSPFYSSFLFYGWGILVINDIVFGIIMIVSGVRMKNRKRTLAEERTKLMVISWIGVGGPVAFGFIYLIFSPFFTGSLHHPYIIPNTYGIAGCVVVIIGLLLKKGSKRVMISSGKVDKKGVETHPIRPEEALELKAEKPYKFCPECGYNLQGKFYSYCPNCGSKIKK
ncbi:MAG: zinc ribbon domain-containing protein [Candidatus Lokiarchaeota archaeon]